MWCWSCHKVSSDRGHFIALHLCLSKPASSEVDSTVFVTMVTGCAPQLLGTCSLPADCSVLTGGKGLPSESKERWSDSLATLEVSIMRLYDWSKSCREAGPP